jgi:hypothetical protein
MTHSRGPNKPRAHRWDVEASALGPRASPDVTQLGGQVLVLAEDLADQRGPAAILTLPVEDPADRIPACHGAVDRGGPARGSGGVEAARPGADRKERLFLCRVTTDGLLRSGGRPGPNPPAPIPLRLPVSTPAVLRGPPPALPPRRLPPADLPPAGPLPAVALVPPPRREDPPAAPAEALAQLQPPGSSVSRGSWRIFGVAHGRDCSLGLARGGRAGPPRAPIQRPRSRNPENDSRKETRGNSAPEEDGRRRSQLQIEEGNAGAK